MLGRVLLVYGLTIMTNALAEFLLVLLSATIYLLNTLGAGGGKG